MNRSVIDLSSWRSRHPGPPKRPAGWHSPKCPQVPIKDIEGLILDGGRRVEAPIEPPAITIDAVDGWEADELAGGERLLDMRGTLEGPAVVLGVNEGPMRGTILLDPRTARQLAAQLRQGATEAERIG